MINPLLTQGRFLFYRNDCQYCLRWKKFIFKFNSLLRVDKRIIPIDCTKYDTFGICNNPIIKTFEKHIDGYPVLFFDGGRKDGANSLIECMQWLKIKCMRDFYFMEYPEFFETINKSELFHSDCKKFGGRLICENVE